jgi:diguanylate cyclase (GGDEF)-like protein/PAS domain S-box-containing protein
MPGFQDPDTYGTILAAMQTGVCVVDLENRILFWNDGAERITGYLRHEVLGRPCAENILLHCTHTNCELCGERCPLVAAVHDSKPVEVSAFFHHKSGHRAPVHVWAVPVRDARGSIIAVAQSFDRRYVAPVIERRKSLAAYDCVDEVTGIANRAMMQAHLRESLGTLKEMHVPFGVLCVRLDELQQLRPKYGQEASNAVLRMVALTLENTLRPTDFVGRWDDDSFLAILTGCNEAGLPCVSDRLYKMIASGSIEWWGGELFAGAISLGQACPESSDTVETITQRIQQPLRNTDSLPRARAAAAGNSTTNRKN